MVIKMAEFKTNVYRIFDSAKLPYTPHTYEHEEERVTRRISGWRSRKEVSATWEVPPKDKR